MTKQFFILLLKMRYVAAYLLAALGGKDSPNAGDIKKILESVGIEADDTRLDKVGPSLAHVLAQLAWENPESQGGRDEMLM